MRCTRDVRLLHLLLRHLLARSPVHSPSMDHAVCMHTHMPNMACTWTWTWTWTCTCTTCACACACKVICTGAGTDATSTHLRARLCAWSVRPAVGAHRQPRAENDLTRSRGWRRARPPRPGSSRYMSAHISYIHTCMCMCMCMCMCVCVCVCMCVSCACAAHVHVTPETAYVRALLASKSWRSAARYLACHSATCADASINAWHAPHDIANYIVHGKEQWCTGHPATCSGVGSASCGSCSGGPTKLRHSASRRGKRGQRQSPKKAMAGTCAHTWVVGEGWGWGKRRALGEDARRRVGVEG